MNTLSDSALSRIESVAIRYIYVKYMPLYWVTCIYLKIHLRLVSQFKKLCLKLYLEKHSNNWIKLDRVIQDIPGNGLLHKITICTTLLGLTDMVGLKIRICHKCSPVSLSGYTLDEILPEDIIVKCSAACQGIHVISTD